MNYESSQRPRSSVQGNRGSYAQREPQALQASARRSPQSGASRSTQGSVRRSTQGGAPRSTQGSAYRNSQSSTPRRAPGNSHGNSYSRSRRKRRMMQRRIRAIVLLMLLIVAIVVIVNLIRGGSNPDVKQPQSAAVFAQQAEATQNPLPVAATVSPEVTPTPEPTPEPTPDTSANAAYRPVAESGLLPVFKKSTTDEKIIAITVDDCFQAGNLAAITQLAIDYGGKLTFFPIGENALKDAQAETLRYAWQNGFELENHTMTHNSLYAVSDERLAQEIYYQNLALSKILGVEYKVHFLRPRGGDARNDQRMQAYARQMGYYGIAHWNSSGSGNKVTEESMKKSLQPGNIYLFHTTDKDLFRLQFFIPYAVSQGYRLVTLNEMFGYPENETSPLTEPIEGRTPPALEPYTPKPVTYKDTTYDHGVIALQEQLIALGYLNGESEGAADGVYGKTCAKAVSKFQSDHGMSITGEADPETQARIEQAYNEMHPAQQTVSASADIQSNTESV